MILWLLSTIGLVFVAQTILYNKQLQGHPQMLIAYICMAECCMSWNALIQVLGPVYVSCYLGLDQIFAWTAMSGQGQYWRGTFNTTDKCAADLMCNSNALFFQFFQLLSLMLNVCLCAYLILTIQSPFTPAGNRAKWYYGISWFVPTFMVIVIHITKEATDLNKLTCSSCISLYTSSSSTVVGTMVTGVGNYILAFVMSVYIIVAIYSVIYAYRRL